MKRAICLFLAFCFLLSLCGCGGLSPEGTTEEPTFDTTEPLSEPAETTAPEPAVFSLKTLPDIGGYVSDEKKAYFFDDGAHETFAPRDDYGKVVPYYANTSVYREVPVYTYTNEDGSSFEEDVEKRSLMYGVGVGLMTRDGRIICEPIYDFFYRMEDADGKKAWELHTENPEEMYSSKLTVIADDGSWKLDFPEGSYVMSDDSDMRGYFKVNVFDDEDNSGVQIFTFDGVPLADLVKLRKKYETENQKLAFKAVVNDRLLLQLYDARSDSGFGSYDEVETDELLDDVYFYTDFKGKKLSDLELAIPFSEMCGDCIVGFDVVDDLVQLFKTDGTPLTKAVEGYYRCDPENGIVLIDRHDIGRIEVYNTEGTLLHQYEMDWNSLEIGPNGMVFLDKEQKKVFRVLDGSEILLNIPDVAVVEGIFESVGRYGGGELYIAVSTKNKRCYLFDLEGNRLARIHQPDIVEANYGDEPSYEMDLFVTQNYVISVNQKKGWYLFDRALQEERKLPFSGINVHWDEEIEELASPDFFGDLMSLYFSYRNDDMDQRSRTELYDLKTGRRIANDLIYSEQTDELFWFTTKRTAVAMEKDGSVLLQLNSNSLI